MNYFVAVPSPSVAFDKFKDGIEWGGQVGTGVLGLLMIVSVVSFLIWSK